MIRLDRFFVKQLQESGVDVDYKKITEIYKESRKRPDYLKQKQKNASDAAAMARFEELLNDI